MVVDIIIIVILALSIFFGYKKGLVELGIGLCAGIIAIVVALTLYRPITNLVINTTSIDEHILEKSKSNEIAEQIAPEIAQELSYNIIRAVVMIVLYLVSKIALRFVTALANLIAKLPILNQFNKVGGIVYGAIRGILVIYVVLLIVSFVGQINPQNKLHTEIQKSFIAKEMYSKNIIELLVK